MAQKINALWLPGWYPSRVDPLAGDFTDRYAVAMSKYISITVLYVVKDTNLKTRNNELIVEKKGNLSIYRMYYAGKDGDSALSKLRSVLKYYMLLFKLYHYVVTQQRKFSVIHIHVPLRQSLLALWLKTFKKLQYVITEQHSWYMEADGGFSRGPIVFQRMVGYVFKNARKVHTVSADLRRVLKKEAIIDYADVIPNLVDTEKFKLPLQKLKAIDGTVNFVTIIGNDFHKNSPGVIQAFNEYLKSGNFGRLHLIGPNRSALDTLVKSLNIEQNVFFYGALKYDEVAIKMQEADALIFFTRYETFGCVMAEALCCGLPVIASDLPVLREQLTDNKNALLVQPENTEDLTKKLIYFSKNRSTFNNYEIAKSASFNFSFDRVALQMLHLYE